MKLQIVKTDKGYVAISDEQPSQKDTRTEDEGKWALSLFDSWVGQLSMEYRGLWRIEWKVNDSVGNLLSNPHQPENYRMIVATDTSFKLEGIPQFELEKDDKDYQLMRAATLTLKNYDLKDEFNVSAAGGFCSGYDAGYKAAQEKGCYSIEDMRKAFDRGEWDGSGKSEAVRNSVFDDFIESLNQPKKLVAIEILTRKTHPRADEYTKDGDIIDVPFTQDKSPEYPDGLVIIKQYYYEHV